MSKANRDVDLDALARPAAAPPARRRRRRLLGLLVPLVLLAGFLAVLASSAGDWLAGGLAVEVVRPAPASAGAARALPGAVAAQAAGWVEPDPFPVRASALVPGVVREVLVQESDAVGRGDVVALLVDEDAALALRIAEADVARSEAELAGREAELAAARESFDAALAVREALASAQAQLDGRNAEVVHREQAVVAAQARVSAAESEVVVQRFLEERGSAGPRAVELAEAELAAVRAAVAVERADLELARAEARAAEAARARAAGDLELRTEDTLRVRAAEAALAAARAALDRARCVRDTAELALERTRVRAPASGLVLQRLAVPGTELTADAAAVATLYDPRSLRVRVDVPQGDVEALYTGQRVRIDADARPGRPYAGEVIRLVQRADIDKVTLQAHVRVADGDELLRPEMLVQARFLARSEPSEVPAAGAEPASTALRVPARLVAGGAVWVLDPAGRSVERRAVEVAGEEGGDAVVVSGLNLTDKVVATELDRLRPGMRVSVRGKER